MAIIITNNINKLKTKINTLDDKVFNDNDLSNLNTNNKNSVLEAINELVIRYNKLYKLYESIPQLSASSGDVLLAEEYDISAIGGILLCSKYNI